MIITSGTNAINFNIPFKQWIYVSYAFNMSGSTLFYFGTPVQTFSGFHYMPTPPLNLALDIEDVYLRDIHIIASLSLLYDFSPYMLKPIYPSMYYVPEVVAYIPCMTLTSDYNLYGFTSNFSGFLANATVNNTQPISDPSKSNC